MEDSREVQAWQALVAAYGRSIRYMDHDLRARHGMPIGEFEALLHVAMAGKILQKDLAERLFLTRAGATRLIDRLQVAGLVSRTSSSDDRRAKFVSLTAAGRTTFDSMAKTHIAHIKHIFEARFNSHELRVLHELLGRLQI